MEIIQNYFKYILVCIVILILLGFSYYFYNNSNKEIKEESVVLKKEETKKEDEEDIDEVQKYVYVDVKGAVNNPNVYMIEEGKRVIDALNASGGLTEDADTSIINLSKKLTDEMCIIVYTKSEIDEYRKQGLETKEIVEKLQENLLEVNDYNDAQIKENKTDSSGTNIENSEQNKMISINTATKEELLTLNGIGESKAESIIEYREENGNFKTIEDIKNVSGIGDALFEKIKDNITV